MQFEDIVEEKYLGELSFITAGELMIRGSSLKYMEETRYPGTGWLLVEFSTSVTWIETLFQLKRLIDKGYSPLLAHPERYRWCRRKKSRLIKLSKMGCGTMVSARSLMFEKYAATARCLLREGLCHILCSDAHSAHDYILDSRLKDKVDKVSKVPWHIITNEMPERILNDMKLPILPLLNRRKSK